MAPSRQLISMCRPSQQSPPVTSPPVTSPSTATPPVHPVPKSARRKHSKVVNPPTVEDNLSNEEPASMRPHKNVRGVCRRIKTSMIVQANGKIKLVYDKRFCGPGKSEVQSLLSHDIGSIVRAHCPMNAPSFRRLPKKDKCDLRDFLTLHYDIDYADKPTSKYIDGIFALRFKGWKHECHKYFQGFDFPEEALASPPLEFLPSDRRKYWPDLCEQFMNPKFRERSIINMDNRKKKKKLNHHGGAKMFVYHIDDLREKNSKFSAVDNFKEVYVKPNNPDATPLYEKMLEKISEFKHENESQYPSDTPVEDIPLPDPSIAVNILTETLQELGPNVGRYVRGMGRGMERDVGHQLSPLASQEQLHSVNEVKELKEELGISREEVKGLKEQLVSQAANYNHLVALLRAKGIASLTELMVPPSVANDTPSASTPNLS